MDSNVLLQQPLIEYLSRTLQKNTVFVHAIDLLVKNVCPCQNVTGFGRVGEKGLWWGRVLFQLWDHLRAVDTAAFHSNTASAVANMDCFFFPHLE